jgi:XTP/dITP diphosphohydrolase
LSRARLWLATTNRKKQAELARLLDRLGIEVRGADAAPKPLVVDEDAPDFAGNARKKALAMARLSGGAALGDDSGLVVDALGGRPGVWSARYAGPDATDADRIAKLLAELAGVPPAQRTARFVCALCLAAPDGRVLVELEGRCEGWIAATPSGTGGFGYDPVFVARAGRDQEPTGARPTTFAELSPQDKDALSHRGAALRQLAAWLRSHPAALDPIPQ